MPYKSPFLIVKDLISPLQCEDTVTRLKHTFPNKDQSGNPTVTLKGNTLSEIRVVNVFKDIIPSIEEHYKFSYKTLTPFIFEWYPTGFLGQKAFCEGSTLINKKGQNKRWQKTKDYDFTVVVFLNDYNNDHDFDERFEVRGGKLEFPTHGFGFNPERGTAIIYPCCPNFVNAVSAIDLGNLNLIRFQIVATKEYIYNMADFPGGYAEWFSQID
jgi:hypothetical protein